MSTLLLKSVHHVHIGREYKAVIGPDGLPALEVIEGRGRPRGLTGEEVIAARALKNLGFATTRISKVLNKGRGATRTALGESR